MIGKAKMEERLRSIGVPRGPAEGSTMIEKWDNALKKFSNLIEQDYNDNREPREEFLKKIEILEEVEDYLAKNVLNDPINGVQYEIKAVVPFGSSASGLGMKGGDLDMTVCVHPAVGRKRKELTKERSNDILGVIFRHITEGKMLKRRKIEDLEHISTARVPIVTGTVDGVDVDISISMTFVVSAQYLSSKFIDAYEKYDRRFILLAAFVKKWLKSKKTEENENYFKQVFPNSCSTVLLVVLFMKHYGLLPNINQLHEDKLGEASISWKMVNQGENGAFGIPNKEVKQWKADHSYEVSLGTLFLLFLDFYTNVVNLKTEKLVIGIGVVRDKARVIARNRVVIADVIDRDNPAKAVIWVAEFQNYLESAINVIKNTDNVKQLMDELLSMQLIEPTMTKSRRGRLRDLQLLCEK